MKFRSLIHVLGARPRTVALAVSWGLVVGGSALAQTPIPLSRQAPAEQDGGQPAAAVEALAEPTFDEGTAQRTAEAMLSYSAIEVRGGWASLASNANLMPGASGEQVLRLRQRLMVTDDLSADAATGQIYDEGLAAAVRHFQARHGLPDSGIVDTKTLSALNVPVAQRVRQLAASLDRMAAMDFTFGQRYVIVNIPAAFADAIEGDRIVRRYPVAVGGPDRPTPTLTTQIAAVNLNPSWAVPLSITKSDIIPQMRKDPGYLARLHMRVLEGNGVEKEPSSVDWQSERAPNFTIRQDPGPWSTLGGLRLTMPNLHSVFMHELNPNDLLRAGQESARSAAVADMRDLAAWLLEDAPNWRRGEIDTAIAKTDQTDIRLPRKVPVAWVYFTGWVTRSGLVQFRDDIYDRDSVSERPLLAEVQRPANVTAARASGFILQSADSRPEGPQEVRDTSYLDRQ